MNYLNHKVLNILLCVLCRGLNYIKMQLFKTLEGQLMQIMHINFAAATSWQFIPNLAKTFGWQILHICHFSGCLITYATPHIRIRIHM